MRTLPATRFARLLAAVICLGPGSATLCAQATATGPVSEFTVNGIKVRVKQRPSTQTVSAGVYFAADQASLTAGKAGIERLLWDTATEGSEHFPREVLRAELARLAANLGYSSNQDYSKVSMLCTADAFDRAFAILADVIMQPALTEADFERRRTQMVATDRSADSDVDGQLRRLVEKTIYAGHPYAVRGEGTADSLSSISLPELRTYHRELLQAARMRVVIVGNVDPADIRRKVKAAFSGLPGGDSPEDGVALLRFSSPSFQRTVLDLPDTYVEGVFAAPAFDGPEMPAFNLLIRVLHNRIFEEVRTKRALAYAPGADRTSTAAGYGYVYFSTGKVDEAARLCLAEIARLKREPVAAADIRDLLPGLRVSQYTNLQTNAAQAEQLAQYELIGGGWRNSLRPAYDAVTPDDIQQAAQKWLNDFQFFLLGPANAAVDEAAFHEAAEPVIAK